MRKGILSLTMGGRGKTGGKKKAKGFDSMEKQTADEQPVLKDIPTAEDKMFVQTIQVPKPGTVHKKVKRKSGAKRPPSGGQS